MSKRQSRKATLEAELEALLKRLAYYEAGPKRPDHKASRHAKSRTYRLETRVAEIRAELAAL